MGKLRNFVTPLHQKTNRNYLERMNDNKILCMKISKKYSKDYWDGKRRFGYGGYNYIPGRWTQVAKKIIQTYNLNSKSKILDVGCGKGFLLYEIKLLIPDIKIYGFDISRYALKKIHKGLEKKNFIIHDAARKFPYKTKTFDLVISLTTLHNLTLSGIKKALLEISRVGKQSYIMVESYKNDAQLFNLQCWALTCATFLKNTEWQWFFKQCHYKGDFEFIYFK